MDEKTFNEYLEKRYEDQVKWYDKKACKNQKIYKIFQWAVIVLSAMTPVLVAIAEKISVVHYAAIVVSFLVAVGTTTLKTFKYQENWINYRATCETLRKEIHFFNGRVNEYKNCDDPRSLFVERVEALIERENTLWLTTQKQKEKEEKITGTNT